MVKKEKKSPVKKDSPQSIRSVSVRGSDPAIYNAVPGSDTEDTNTTGASTPPPVTPSKQKGRDKKKGKKKGRKDNDSDDDDIELQRKPSPVVAPLPQLSKEEFEFFEMVKSGDADQVAAFLASEAFKSMNINKTNKTGYTVLHIAVRRQDEPMVALLLQQPGIRLYDTLLHAIKEHNVEITKILLQLYDKAVSEEEKQRFMSTLYNNENSTQLSALVSSTSAINVAPPISPISARSGVKSSIRVKNSSGIRPPQQGHSKSKPKEAKVKSRANIPLISVYPHMDETDEADEMPFDSEFPPVITPLMLAAQEGCIPLMELFYSRDERLESVEFPHNVGCQCDICAKLEGDQDMTRAYQRYHLFKAITQPDYICFMARKEKLDPVNYAIQKIVKVREIIEIDMAFNPLFHDFEPRLEKFISTLLQLCRNTAETEIFLSPKDAEGKERLPHLYPRLWYTVGLELKEFVAQPNAQNIAYKMWATDDWPDWDTYGWIYRCFNLAIRIPGFIFIALILLLGQDSSIGHLLNAPVSRFLTYIASYIVFMVFVCYQALWPYQRCNDGWLTQGIEDINCKKRGPPNLGSEWFIVLYILGFYVSMLKRQSISWYWSMRWNWLDLITQLTFTATFICWIWAWVWTQIPENQDLLMITDRTLWPNDSAETFGDCFLAVSVLLASARMLRFLGVHPELGPIQVALGKQVVDFLNTALIIFVVVFAFSSGLIGLYMPYKGFRGIDTDDHNLLKDQDDSFQSIIKAPKTLFFYLYGDGGPDTTKLLQWVVKNDSGADVKVEHYVTQYTGLFLFMVYNTIGSTMLFNMLSGYFSNTFNDVMANVDVEWKFARTELYMTFIKDTVLPPPFNLLPTLKGLTQAIKFMGLLGKNDDPKASCSCRQCCYVTQNLKTEKWRRLMKGYRKLVLQLLYRYRNLREDEEGEEEATKDDILEIEEELAEIKAMLKKTKGENASSDDDDDNNDDFPSGGGGAGTVASTASGKKGWSKPKYMVESAGSTYLKNTAKAGGTGGVNRSQTGSGRTEATPGTSGTVSNRGKGNPPKASVKSMPVVTTQPLPTSSQQISDPSNPAGKVQSGKMSLTFLPYPPPKRTSGSMDFGNPGSQKNLYGSTRDYFENQSGSRGSRGLEHSTGQEEFSRPGNVEGAYNYNVITNNATEWNASRATGYQNTASSTDIKYKAPVKNSSANNMVSPSASRQPRSAIPFRFSDDETGVATDGSSRADYDSHTFSTVGPNQAPFHSWL